MRGVDALGGVEGCREGSAGDEVVDGEDVGCGVVLGRSRGMAGDEGRDGGVPG